MLRPHDMTKILISGPRAIQESIINELHSLKVLHIVDYAKSELADIGTPLEKGAFYSETLVKIRALISALDLENVPFKSQKRSLIEIISLANKLGSEINSLKNEQKQISDQKNKNENARKELELLKNFNISIEYLFEVKSLFSFYGFFKNKEIFDKVINDLTKVAKEALPLYDHLNGRIFSIIFVGKKSKDNASKVLSGHGFSPVNFQHIKGIKGTAARALLKINEENQRLEIRLLDIERKIKKLAGENKDALLSAQNFLSEQLEKAEAPLRFASTKSSFLVSGWVPTDDLQKIIDRLNKAGKNKIYVHFDSAKKNDKVPVKLRNPNLTKPFEFLIDLYSYPNYREIDPTLFLFLTFPLFFGVMLGDIGYGIVGLLLFWFLKKKIPSARGLFNVLIVSSIMGIIFGVLFGEIFGYEFLHLTISREHDINSLMFFAISLGILHVNIGLVIGFVNELKSHGIKHAIFAKLSWIILEIGFAIIMLSIYGMIKINWYYGLAICAAASIMLLKGEGVRGLIELPSIFTNILSYARLMAIGLSSVIIAVIVNEAAVEMFHKGGFMILGALLILILGHALNLILGLFGSFLHSLRLHYVEFFSKFFIGGSEKYRPFGYKE